ncbi:hypothetical protein GCM10009817_26140 [Terrabacter lapilli]|uniref:Uncharacterized protein n=2 Tax=Terrabacter lapilli TaxID=436231 RepID=A0ABN2SCX2_9MICO
MDGMSTDTAPWWEPGAEPAGDAAPRGWLLEQRGSFVLGRCDGCGFTTAARRARFSVESDMEAHVAGCGGRSA